MLVGDLDSVVIRDDSVKSSLRVDLSVHDLLVHHTVGGYLTEHVERVKPGVDGLQADLVIDLGDGDTLDVDGAAVGFGGDLLTLAAERQRIIP